MSRSFRLAILSAALLVSAFGAASAAPAAPAAAPAKPATFYWYCNTNPTSTDKIMYVTDVFGPFDPDPDRVVAQADVKADFTAFIAKKYPEALMPHKGSEDRITSCSVSTQQDALKSALNDIKKIEGRGHTIVETHWNDPEGMAGKGAHLKRIDPNAPKADPKGAKGKN